VKTWPAEGPKLLWQIDTLGKGYSTVSIAGGKILSMGDRRAAGGDERQFVIALDLATHEELWSTPIGPPHSDGPRCTPTIDGPRVYALGTDADLVCLEAATGKVVWQRNLAKDFGGKMMSGWKYSESPVVDGDRLVCTPGGPQATIVALDKKTGEVIWKSAIPEIGKRGKDGAGYASIVIAEIDGVRQYVQILGRGAASVAADSGKFLWGYNRVANGVANIPSAVVRGNDVFVTTSYKTGCAALKVTRNGDSFNAEEVYFLDHNTFENHHGGVVLVGDHIYGGDGQNNGTPVCLELASGRVAWKEKTPGKGSAAVLYADGHLYFRYQNGLVALIEATPEEFRVKSTFTPAFTKGNNWAHPVIHDGKLYLRQANVLMCYDVLEQ
jgi:outer membrane protein assembly factor BamB